MRRCKFLLLLFIFLMLASVIAWIGTCGNLLLTYLFITKTYPNTPSALYPTVLSILDALICILYIMLFSVDAATVYLRVTSFFIIYHIYIVPAYVVSRITQLAIPYVLILSTLERLVWISGEKTIKFLKIIYSYRGHQIIVILLLICCIISRLPTAFAVLVSNIFKLLVNKLRDIINT
ncbi:unnamed protein product [Thelazia callipaeda]|uniref:G_PROTEIN_RECEP_F1_2 domain-containing protein n=1 Tax=Thelazia callipaeda TaxID=103827 RepID=A0A0N5CQD6_THECL|nr:unnamed protein product [Thelazia callipaeda]